MLTTDIVLTFRIKELKNLKQETGTTEFAHESTGSNGVGNKIFSFSIQKL